MKQKVKENRKCRTTKDCSSRPIPQLLQDDKEKRRKGFIACWSKFCSCLLSFHFLPFVRALQSCNQSGIVFHCIAKMLMMHITYWFKRERVTNNDGVSVWTLHGSWRWGNVANHLKIWGGKPQEKNKSN